MPSIEVTNLQKTFQTKRKAGGVERIIPVTLQAGV